MSDHENTPEKLDDADTDQAQGGLSLGGALGAKMRIAPDTGLRGGGEKTFTPSSGGGTSLRDLGNPGLVSEPGPNEEELMAIKPLKQRY
ncbi:MAG: hypothetical protein AAGD13_12220 [Pseudomonadota bacterium]